MNSRRHLPAFTGALLITLLAGSPLDGISLAAPLGCPGWQVVYTPTPNGNAVLTGIAAVPGTDQLWSVGYTDPAGYDQTLIERWDGASWDIVPSPNRPQGNNYLLGVAAVAPDDVWAVGRSDVPLGGTNTLVLHWDGTTWSLVGSPNVMLYNQLVAVTVESAQSIWAVGYYYSPQRGQQTLIEHWDGTAWSLVPSPNVGVHDNLLEGVTAVTTIGGSLAQMPVWAVGYYYRDDGLPSTLFERWDGKSWSVIPSPDGGPRENYLTSIAAGGPQDIWAVGVYNTAAGAYLTLTEHWNGQNWQVVPSPNLSPSYSGLTAVAVVGSDQVWAVGSYYNELSIQLTLTEEWDGTSWQIVPSPSPGGYERGSASVLTALALAPFEVPGGGLRAVGAFHPGYTAFQAFAEFYCMPARTGGKMPHYSSK
jgi:hypothetical protein